MEELLDPKTLVSVKEIWYSDDWEIFFAAKREKPYRQLAVNPAGAHVEYHWDDGGTEWDAGAIYTSDTSLPDRWRVRISLPLEKLLPGGVRPGTPFYANFYRTVAGQVEHLAWNPNFVKNFQELSRLGEFTLE